MMVSTPPGRSARAHTPPAPRHGPKDDDYEPYSPRRSTRSTLSRNPYSSFNSDRSVDRKKDSSRERTPVRQRGGYTTPPPTTARKRARFAQSVSQLSSPPVSPIARCPSLKTPQRRRSARTSTSPANHEGLDKFDHLSSPVAGPASLLTTTSADPTFSLLTPSKTPTRRNAGNTSQKRSFNTFIEPVSPSHVMPPSRKIKRFAVPAELDLESSPSTDYSSRHIPVYTDPQSRVPELDTSESNPFISRQNVSSDVEMSTEPNQAETAPRFSEGVLYMKRGKKIFRPFAGFEDTYTRSSDVEAGAPLRHNPKIKPIDLLKSQYQPRNERNNQRAGPAASAFNNHADYDTNDALRLINEDASDSEASTLSGGEMSPTIAFSTYKRKGGNASAKPVRNTRPRRTAARNRSMPLDNPFADS